MNTYIQNISRSKSFGKFVLIVHIHHNVFQHTVSSLIKMVCKTSHAYPRESKCVHKFVLASNSWLWKRQIAHGEPLGTILHWWILKVCGLDAYYAGLDLDGFWHSKLTLKIQIWPFNLHLDFWKKIRSCKPWFFFQHPE